MMIGDYICFLPVILITFSQVLEGSSAVSVRVRHPTHLPVYLLVWEPPGSYTHGWLTSNRWSTKAMARVWSFLLRITLPWWFLHQIQWNLMLFCFVSFSVVLEKHRSGKAQIEQYWSYPLILPLRIFPEMIIKLLSYTRYHIILW